VKILYVEDELSKNITGIIRLFEKYLGKKRIRRLKALEEDESGYEANPDEIIDIVEETNLVEVEYRFPDALHKVICQHEKYALLIVDRNLAEYEAYDFEEVMEIDSAFTDSQYERFFEREGDYLLHKLVYETDVMSRFYLLTGNSIYSDPIRGYDDISTLIDFGKFSEKNFFEKGNEAELQKLIENVPILNLQNENKYYLNILKKHIDDKAAELFLEVLHSQDDAKRIRDNLNRIRIIYENILEVCSDVIPDMKRECGSQKGGNTILWLKDRELIDDVILRNFLFSIRKIANEFGGHKPYPYNPICEPTPDTVRALVYALKDVIRWFGRICSKYPAGD